MFLRCSREFCSKVLASTTAIEAETILQQLNKSSVADLSQFKISESRAAKIIEHRTENGLFESCEDLLKIKGIGGSSAVNRLFQSILSPDPPKKAKDPKSMIFTVPETYNDISNITSCSSIRVGISNISWTSFELFPEDRKIEVVSLENFTFDERKLHVGELVNKVISASKLIPDSQCYVFENPKLATPGTPGNAEQVNINVQQSQVLAMLSLILKQRKTSSLENVFYLKRYIYAKLFKCLVGSEVVSTKSVLDEILGHGQGQLTIDYDIKSKFKDLEHFEQEHLRQALLMGLAFINLSVFKCEKSLQSLAKKD